MSDDRRVKKTDAVADVVALNIAAPEATEEKQGAKYCKLRSCWVIIYSKAGVGGGVGGGVSDADADTVLSFSTSLVSPSRFTHRLIFVSRSGSHCSIFHTHKIGGCCCDFRRAVIIMAVIAIVRSIIGLVLSAVFLEVAATVSFVNLIINVIAVLFYVFQLMAAIKYNVCMLITAIGGNWILMSVALWFGYYTAVDATSLAANIFGSIIFYGLEIYATHSLSNEINAGTMSAKTYPREAYSCCCMPNV
jgi:hypothetical protein